MPALNWGKKVDISGILSVCQEQEETVGGWGVSSVVFYGCESILGFRHSHNVQQQSEQPDFALHGHQE